MLLSSVQLGVVVDGRDRVLGAISVDAISDALRAPVAGATDGGMATGYRRREASALREGQPFFRVDWVIENADVLARRIGEQLVITGIAIMVGFVLLSFAVALLVRRYPRLYGPVLGPRGLLLDPQHRPVRAADPDHRPVAADRRDRAGRLRDGHPGAQHRHRPALGAARGAGGGRRDGHTASQRLWRVEVPIAVPIIVAGLRIATVTIMGLVTIATLIGMGGLGYLIVNIGIKQRFPTATLVGGRWWSSCR